MAISLDDILKIVNYFCSKEQEGQSFSVKQFNEILPFACNEVFNLYIYKDFDTTQRFTDASLPFKVFMGQKEYVNDSNVTIPAIPPLMIDSNGYAPIPADYKHYSALRYKQTINKPGCAVQIKDRDVYVLTDQEFDGYANSSLKKGSYKYPVCNFQKGFIRFEPKDLHYVDFVYLKYPITPVYKYSINLVTQQVIYDSVNSVQTEFRDEENYKLIGSLLSAVGVNLNYEVIQNEAAKQQAKNLVA